MLTLEGRKGRRVWVEVMSRSGKRRLRTSSKIKYKKDRQTKMQTLLSAKKKQEQKPV